MLPEYHLVDVFTDVNSTNQNPEDKHADIYVAVTYIQALLLLFYVHQNM
jgi:hypothetical protein